MTTPNTDQRPRLFRKDYAGTIWRCALCPGELFVASSHVHNMNRSRRAEKKTARLLGAPAAESERRRQHGLAHVRRCEAFLSPDGHFVLPAPPATDHGFRPEALVARRR
jgi:hypothetical protein